MAKTSTKKATIAKALKKRSRKILAQAITDARKLYPAPATDTNILIDTIHGDLPLSVIWDKDTVWVVVEAEYARLLQEVSRIDSKDNISVEKAKLVAKSSVLNTVAFGKSDTDSLL